MPDLVQIQRDSYFRFLKHGLIEELDSFSPIIDYTGRLEFHILTKDIKFRYPKHTLSTAKKAEQTYSTQIYVPIKIVDKNNQKEYFEEVFIADFPLMTDRGTFIINGIERIIVNQIIRSPGIFYKVDKDKLERQTYNLTFIPYRGSWLRIELDKNNLVWVRIDKTKRISAYLFLKALGLTNKRILENLEKWLRDFNSGHDGRIDVPLLVIDDEADSEPPREFRRQVDVSYAASAGASSEA
jgi:DNA-directed RNA polymerase subunit beta